VLVANDVIWRDVYGLYSEGWGERMVAEAMAHPAKVRPALAREIFDFALKRGWWKKGDTLVDPFGGVGGFLLTGGWARLRLIGIELEPRFVALANENIELHAAGWDAEHPRPVIIQGDSQDLARIVREACGGCTSPPYESDALGHRRGEAGARREAKGGFTQGHTQGSLVAEVYGSDPRNLGNMPSGGCASPPFGSSDSAGPESLHRRKDATAAKMLACQGWHGGGQESEGNLAQMPMAGGASSPPYEAISPGQGGLNTLPPREGSSDQTGRKAGPSQVITGGASSPPYEQSLQNPGGSRTPGAPDGFKLGRSTAGVVSSPPFQGVTATQDPEFLTPGERGKTVPSKSNDASYGNTPGQLGGMPSGIASSPPFEDNGTAAGGKQGAGTYHGTNLSQGINRLKNDYAVLEADGNLGNPRGTTFWDALRVILLQQRSILPEGAVCAWVVADFVRNKKRVNFCDDCAALIEQTGYTVFERWRCWKVSKGKHMDMFTGESEHAVSHLGFFRRLAQKKGSPACNNEEVIWFRAVAPQPQEAPDG